MDMAKSMLFEKRMPKEFWPEVVNTIVYLLNRCPKIVVWSITPFKSWSGRKLSVNHLKVFGCVCYAQVPKVKRKKLEESSYKCIFIDYRSMSKGYILYNLKTKKVIFNEMLELAKKKRVEEKTISTVILEQNPTSSQSEENVSSIPKFPSHTIFTKL